MSEAEKPTEQPNSELSEVMGQLSMTSDDSDRVSTPPKNLSDMPVDVVIEKSEYKQQPVYKSIQLDFWNQLVDTTFKKEVYINQLWEDRFDMIIVVREDLKKAAFDDLASILKNPKIQLEEFIVRFSDYDEKDVEEDYNEIRNILESLNHQVAVKKVELYVLSPSTLLSILPCLKPGFLENIALQLHEDLYEDLDEGESRETDWRLDSIGMDKVALLDQWKQAEELELRNCFDRFPMEYAKHFKRFHINEDKIDGFKFISILEALPQLDNFEHCTLTASDFDKNLLACQLLRLISRSSTEEVYHHPSPCSDYYFEFNTSTMFSGFHITKKKRESDHKYCCFE